LLGSGVPSLKYLARRTLRPFSRFPAAGSVVPGDPGPPWLASGCHERVSPPGRRRHGPGLVARPRFGANRCPSYHVLAVQGLSFACLMVFKPLGAFTTGAFGWSLLPPRGPGAFCANPCRSFTGPHLLRRTGALSGAYRGFFPDFSQDPTRFSAGIAKGRRQTSRPAGRRRSVNRSTGKPSGFPPQGEGLGHPEAGPRPRGAPPQALRSFLRVQKRRAGTPVRGMGGLGGRGRIFFPLFLPESGKGGVPAEKICRAA